MIIRESKLNPMAEILALFSNDFQIVTHETLELFKVYLVAAGYTCETPEELGQCLKVLVDMKVLEYNDEENKIRKLINV